VKESVVKRMGYTANEMTLLMRTLTMCTAAAKASSYSYADVKNLICVDSDEALEQAVVDAVSSGLLEASLDQEKETVEFTMARPRAFDSTQSWDDLFKKLSAWRRDIAHVHFVVHQSREQSQ